MEPGFWSLLPLLVALLFAFVTRSAIPALLGGVIVGAFMMGGNLVIGLNNIFQEALGNGNFIWICQIVLSIGVLTELFKRSGAISGFAARLDQMGDSKKSVRLTTWGLGLLIIDDYFSPLLTGTIMRPLSDKARIPREKLAYLLDALTSPVCVLVPFLAYGAYIASLIVAQGGAEATPEAGMALYIRSIPFNFYSIITVLFAGGIALGWIPDFGPMRRAENRVALTGELIRPGASPLISDSELPDARPSTGLSLALYLGIPIMLIMTIALGSYWVYREILIAEAFMTAVAYLSVTMSLKGHFKSLGELVDVAMKGIMSILPALLIIAFAYSLNTVTEHLGAAVWLIDVSEGMMTKGLLVAITFVLAAIISFSTGTSWGTFALVMPLALPLAYAFSSGPSDPLVLETIAAVTGGGIFGDHTSPVSDTSVLSSAGAGSDHMDHIITQLPYALTVAGATALLYLFI
ncbi:MAG: transporter [Bacteroidetes Order II. Incertae sedis bacterium]|nr:transporter [Bacteroidetes Order II. bacterium]MBT4601851.1 transporter [Bacteroidetes Order II. bacterium]MBT5249146.1 transporter [Bacteroidetes Order II. bacterium]MBT6199508.1 transporter [Bacteroidetes Order II. bacterium]MBT6424004.1 transporter [Bacteroidetes Order II. bacterium]